MKIAQGSLEYLVLIAVALAIISVVTLIAVNYLGAQQGQYSYNLCKNAAANCKVALTANPNDKCSYCDVECKASDGTDIFTNAPVCCKFGRPEFIYEGATGDNCDQECGSSEECGECNACVNGDCTNLLFDMAEVHIICYELYTDLGEECTPCSRMNPQLCLDVCPY